MLRGRARTGWNTCIAVSPENPQVDGLCGLGTMAAGKTLTLTLGFTAAVRPSGDCSIVVFNRIGGRSYSDAKPDDNMVKVTVQVS